MKAPSFQFYPGDWLGSTKISLMTPEEEGGYIRLLCHMWSQEECSLQSDDDTLSKLSRLNEKWMICKQNILKCFSEKNGKLFNKRLMNEKKKQSNFRKKQASNGSKGGRPKKGLGIFGLSQIEAKKSSSSSSSSSINNINVVGNSNLFFEMFRRVTGKHISDEELLTEASKFQNKFPNIHPNKAGALINAWVANIGSVKPTVKKMVL